MQCKTLTSWHSITQLVFIISEYDWQATYMVNRLVSDLQRWHLVVVLKLLSPSQLFT